MKVCLNNLKRLFSSKTKYFKDDKMISTNSCIYLDLEMVADDKLESMHKLTGIFSHHKINMTYIKTHL